ncbi:hypothetical protein H2198_009503 [Neophaeococcomyces mojaviensis]|uniref:Uncharacterized protein n=1 Tax=Neophaeococcomyces mojaviensis TaxID=3383035 RepID=A0ACC2ZUF6_9EURO|nr:hypothetical protein H2198_009503 [Knufia sp. JES_112]
MDIITSIVVQVILLALSLFITILRCWVRLRLERRALTISDYLIWGGWACSVGWVMCSITTLHLQIDHPLDPVDLTSDSVTYLKVRDMHTTLDEMGCHRKIRVQNRVLTGLRVQTVFLACYFFDIGLYFPKASIMTFYWWLIPPGFRRLRVGLYIGTAYLVSAFLTSILMDTLMTRPISDNWSIENQLNSIWNSYTDFAVNWTLNISTDLLLFCLPFFVLNCLQLRRRQKIGLIGVFSLGLITICISLARFIAYTATDYGIDDADGNAWCTAEMCTAVIVASLPGLKKLIVRGGTPSNAHYSRSTHGYDQKGSGLPISTSGTSQTRIKGGRSEDELEQVSLPGSMGKGAKDAKNVVMVTKDITVTAM